MLRKIFIIFLALLVLNCCSLFFEQNKEEYVDFTVKYLDTGVEESFHWEDLDSNGIHYILNKYNIYYFENEEIKDKNLLYIKLKNYNTGTYSDDEASISFTNKNGEYYSCTEYHFSPDTVKDITNITINIIHSDEDYISGTFSSTVFAIINNKYSFAVLAGSFKTFYEEK